MQILRPYQVDAVYRCRSRWAAKVKRLLLVSAVGSGKTTCFTEVIRLATAAGLQVLVCVHREELLDQASKRLTEFGIRHGVIAAGKPRGDIHALVQLASIDTLRNRPKPEAQLVVLDEAHRAKAKTWESVLEHYPDAYVLGVTATPLRLDGKPLGDIFQEMVVVDADPADLIRDGFLAPYTGFAFDTPQLEDVRRRGSDFDEGGLVTAMSRSAIVGNVLEQWGRFSRDLSTVLFTVNIQHSRDMTDKFKGGGVRAEHVDGKMRRKERRAILERVASGRTQVVSTVDVLSEGYDCPRLKCVGLLRPTMSLTKYIQQVGRVRRPWNDLTARIHDHSGNVMRHSLPDAKREWSLDGAPPRPGRGDIPNVRQCPACFALYDPAENTEGCPVCGNVVKRPRSGPEFIEDGTMVSFEELEKPPPGAGDPPDKRAAYYAQQVTRCKVMGWKIGRAAVLYKARYGVWPPQSALRSDV